MFVPSLKKIVFLPSCPCCAIKTIERLLIDLYSESSVLERVSFTICNQVNSLIRFLLYYRSQNPLRKVFTLKAKFSDLYLKPVRKEGFLVS